MGCGAKGALSFTGTPEKRYLRLTGLMGGLALTWSGGLGRRRATYVQCCCRVRIERALFEDGLGPWME